MLGYIVVTIYCIKVKCELRSAALEFRYFPLPQNMHTTLALLLFLLSDFNIGTKLEAIIAVSIAGKPPAMAIVGQALNDQFSLCLEEEIHVRCVFHVINRAVMTPLNTSKIKWTSCAFFSRPSVILLLFESNSSSWLFFEYLDRSC